MYASQLLRILKTFPAHVNNENCDFDTDEQMEAMKESPRRYTNPFLSDEENEKINFWNNEELEHSNIKDDLTNNHEDENFKKSLAPCNVPSEFFEKETESYTDKNVMDYELPELLICYKESAFHVKDICVDEGLPNGEKILFNEDNHEIFCNPSLNEDKHDDVIEGSLDTQFLKPELLRFSPSDLPILEVIADNHDEMIEGNLDIGDNHNDHSECCTKSDSEISVQDEQNSVPGKDREDDAIKECELKNMSKDDNDDEDHDNDDDGAPYELKGCDLKNLSKDDDDDYEDDAPCELKFNVEENSSSENLLDSASTEQVASNSEPSLQQDRPPPSLKFLLESIKNRGHVDPRPCENPREGTSKMPLVGHEAEEVGISHQTTEVSKGSTIKGFNNSKPETTNGVNGTVNHERVYELPVEPQVAPNQDHVDSDNVTMASQVHRGEGESSFSVAGPVSGHITYSGPIAFSGSISLRSDSSTTSARSFAFPILQTEWNSSPVRMAKADRRRLQKHRGWRHGLLCCRF